MLQQRIEMIKNHYENGENLAETVGQNKTLSDRDTEIAE